MRRAPKFAACFLALLAPVFLMGADDVGDAEVDDGLDVWFRDVGLSAMSAQELATYIDAEPGESEKLERAFPDAPPQISHTLEDMLPITWDDNECIECHHPDNVTDPEEMPIPDSHFERPVIVEGRPDDAMRSVVRGYEKGDDVYGARFGCMMCHVPQATNVKTPKSTFVRQKERISKEKK
jgi:nitrate reductase cytochrome c-type subunit